MTNMEFGIYGAKRQTWQGRSARSMLQRMLARNPNISTADLAEAMLPKLESEKIAIEILEYWIANTRRALLRSEPVMPTPEERETKVAEIQTRVAAAVIKTKSVWLASVMASTFGDLAKAGPKFIKLSKMGKPNQKVSDVLSESAVQKILGA